MNCDFRKNLEGRDRLKRVADFLFEVGMLRKTPRSGYQFLGSGRESVAEHSFRAAVIGYALADLAGADPGRTALMCLFHDVHEARTGDFNYVNHNYNQCRSMDALRDCLAGTGLTGSVTALVEELEQAASLEARLAQDADQVDLILSLKEEQDLGNPYAAKWLDHALPRIRTDVAREFARIIRETDQSDWWFVRPDESWWRRGNGKRRP
jgi:putative hydrolase of HD superfamily